MRRTFVAVLVVGLVAVSCGDSSTEGTVIFGEGEVPEAIPEDLPIPADAEVGPTLVDTVNTKSEFEYRTATDMEVLVQALSVQLVELGYVILDSGGDVATWGIDFRRDNLEGTVQIRALGPGFAQAVVTVNDA